MFKVFATNVVVSKGYENTPALKYFGKDDSCVQFRVGEKVYDTNAENNTRWVNHTVKAFGEACERIKKMQLKEGSFVNINGSLTEEVWTEGEGDNQVKKSAQVIVLDSRDSIEYTSGGGKKSTNDTQAQGSSQKKGASDASNDGRNNPEKSGNFTGYGPFDGKNFFDEK